MVSHKSTKSSKLRKQNKRKFSPAQEAILTTIAYSDIYSFAPTKEELWHFLISQQKITKPQFKEAYRSLSSLISEEETYLMLRGKEQFAKKRLENKTEVKKKLLIAKKAAKMLSSIPTILFIGISGGLAAENVGPHDDIDLFIITQKNRVFITRFWALLLLSVMGLRRKRGAKIVANKICTNLFIDQTNLLWSSPQDIYTAREIAQIKPLFERKNTYMVFIQANAWIANFFPNVVLNGHFNTDKQYQPLSFLLRLFTIYPLEVLSRWLQKGIMKPHQTTEIVTDHFLGLHPFDYRMKTLNQLKLKMRDLGLLTKD